MRFLCSTHQNDIQKGKETHQTKCGGFLSIIFFSALGVFIVQRTILLLTFGADEFSQNEIYRSLEENTLNLTRDILDFRI